MISYKQRPASIGTDVPVGNDSALSRHPLKPEVVVHLSVIRILRLRSAFLVVAPGLGFAFSDDTEAPAARDVDAVPLMTAEGRWAAATWAHR